MGYLVAAGVIVVTILVIIALAYANRADPRWHDEMQAHSPDLVRATRTGGSAPCDAGAGAMSDVVGVALRGDRDDNRSDEDGDADIAL